MKISLFPDILQKKLSLLNHAVTNKQLPILSHILVETKNGEIYLSATDLEIGIEVSFPADVQEEGIIAIPAKLFSELINTLPQEHITLETKENSLTVTSKKTRSVLQVMSKDEFPTLYEEKGEELFHIQPEVLQKNLSLVVFATSLDTTRPALAGVYMKQTEKGFLFVATDGYRLSVKINKELKTEGKEEEPVLIPSRVIREALSLKETGDIQIFLSPQSNQVLFSQQTTTIVGRLIEAQYPKYQKIIPADASAKIVFDREELLKAVKTCSLFVREAANIVTFFLQKDKLVVSAKSPSLGENMVEVEARLTGEENEIAFNSKYVLDFLANMTEEHLIFEMTGPLNPGAFKIPGDDSFLHVIMPIRT